jgi:hypothetical protein
LNWSEIWEVDGPIDLGLLAAAADVVVARHETLRTSYDTAVPRTQIVEAPWSVAVDTTELDATEGKPDDSASAVAEAVRVVHRAAMRPFDLGEPRALRLDAVRLARDHHVLGVCVDHMAADPPSLALLVSELVATYAALRSPGKHAALPDLPIQYTDYARWARVELDEAGYAERHAAYWARTLAGVDFSALPAGAARAEAWRYEGHVLHFDIDPARRAGLASMAAAQRATIFSALLGAASQALSTACDADEITFATTVAHRPRAECRNLIGLFANLVLLRTTGMRARPWPEVTAKARDTILGALGHGAIPFGQLIQLPGVLQLLDRTRSFWPLIHYAEDVEYKRSQTQSVSYTGFRMTTLADTLRRGAGPHLMLPVDLHLVFWDRGDNIRGELRCNTCVFDNQAAEGLLDAICDSLESAARAGLK